MGQKGDHTDIISSARASYNAAFINSINSNKLKVLPHALFYSHSVVFPPNRAERDVWWGFVRGKQHPPRRSYRNVNIYIYPTSIFTDLCVTKLLCIFYLHCLYLDRYCIMAPIKTIEYFRVKPRWLFVKIVDAEGHVGWGEATLEGHTQAVEGTLNGYITRFVGLEAEDIEHIWQLAWRKSMLFQNHLSASLTNQQAFTVVDLYL
jgi:hypothetical protein